MKATAKIKRPSIVFPSAVRRMDTLNDLLAASDLVSLHCVLTNETTHILNAERLQHIKPGKMVPSCFLFFSVFHLFFLGKYNALCNPHSGLSICSFLHTLTHCI
jgi:hypothetical protein